MVPITKISGRLGNQMFQLAYLHAQMWDGLVDDIYLQDYRHFDHYRANLQKLFGEGIPGRTDMVAIHVRRGGNPVNPNEPDYSKNPFYVNLSETDYYERAMAEFPDADFLVFSDDIAWCKEQEIFRDCEFAEGSELEDMNLMASCVGHIIANSSFSYWGAYLSPYSKKIVYPREWYADEVERTICPPHWVAI